MEQLELFDRGKEKLKIIPTSVIDISAQKKRVMENHSTTSSRANYSPFPEEVSDLCYEFYLRDKQNIFDPFAGWGERHKKAIQYGKKYIGYDTSKIAIKNAADNYGVTNRLANSLVTKISPFNGMLTCPPYFNLEKYSGDGIDKNKTWYTFLWNLQLVFQRCYAAAEEDAIFCIVVGDWRKNHIYYDLVFEMEDMFKNFGATIIDKVVLSKKKVSKIKIMLPQAKRLGYSVKVHENLLVFKK